MRKDENFFGGEFFRFRCFDFGKIFFGSTVANTQNIPSIHAGFGNESEIFFLRERTQNQVRSKVRTAVSKNAKRIFGIGGKSKASANGGGGNADAENRAGTFTEKKAGV